MRKPTIDELEIMTPDELGWLLIHAIWESSKDFQFIQDIIDVGCPINRYFTFWTPLNLAIHLNKIELVKFLLSKGAEINYARNEYGTTALHVAAQWGRIELVKFLISKGADIHISNNAGNIAWNLASDKIRKSCPELEPK